MTVPMKYDVSNETQPDQQRHQSQTPITSAALKFCDIAPLSKEEKFTSIIRASACLFSAESYQVSNYSNQQSNASVSQDEISTIYITGFPDDIQEREFLNMFIFARGFEGAALKMPNNADEGHCFAGASLGHHLFAATSSTSNFGFNNHLKRQIIGFAKFSTREEALHAIEVINGKKIDPDKECTLKAEIAKKNLYLKKQSKFSFYPSYSGSKYFDFGSRLLSRLYQGMNEDVKQDFETSIRRIGSFAEANNFNSGRNFLQETTSLEGRSHSYIPESSNQIESDTEQLATSCVHELLIASENLNSFQNSAANNAFVPDAGASEPTSAVFESASFQDLVSMNTYHEPKSDLAKPIGNNDLSDSVGSLSIGQKIYMTDKGNSKHTVQPSPSQITGANQPTRNSNSSINSFQIAVSGPLFFAHGESMLSPNAQTQQHPHTQSAKQILNDQNNPPCNTLYVGNLPMNASEQELRELFGTCPGYKRMCFRVKPNNGPMCFVEFESVKHAASAMNSLHGIYLSNSTKGGIRLSFSKNPLGVRSLNSSWSDLQHFQPSSQPISYPLAPNTTGTHYRAAGAMHS